MARGPYIPGNWTAKQRMISIAKQLRALKKDFDLESSRGLSGDCDRVDQAIAAVDNIRANWWSGVHPPKRPRRGDS